MRISVMLFIVYLSDTEVLVHVYVGDFSLFTVVFDDD